MTLSHPMSGAPMPTRKSAFLGYQRVSVQLESFHPFEPHIQARKFDTFLRHSGSVKQGGLDMKGLKGGTAIEDFLGRYVCGQVV